MFNIANIEKFNYKLNELDKRQIVIEHELDRSKQNCLAICKRYNISETTFYKVINKYTKEERQIIVDESIKDLKKKFAKKTTILIDKLLDRLQNEIQNQDNININQITTSLGILYDKNRLEDNLSTSNNSININIKIDK